MKLQVEGLRQYAAERSYIVAGITQEYGNGLSLNRRGLLDVLAAVRNGRTDIVLVKSISRIARRTDQLLEFLRFLRGYGISFESTLCEAIMMLPVSVYAR